MSDKLPSRKQALRLLKENGCSTNIVNHCLAVAEVAGETAKILTKKGLSVNLELVAIGALLHDIGRSRTHGVNHAVEGARIAKSAGLPGNVISIIKRHVGGGITGSEARALGWSDVDFYVPVTIEEKVVSFADKLVQGSTKVPVDVEIERLYTEGKPKAAERVKKLHDEIAELIGDCP